MYPTRPFDRLEILGPTRGTVGPVRLWELVRSGIEGGQMPPLYSGIEMKPDRFKGGTPIRVYALDL